MKQPQIAAELTIKWQKKLVLITWYYFATGESKGEGYFQELAKIYIGNGCLPM